MAQQLYLWEGDLVAGSDGIANVTITEAGIFNHASSAQGIIYNRILVSSQFTLANSDIAAIRIYSAIGSR